LKDNYIEDCWWRVKYCNKKIRPCILLDAVYDVICARKHAFTNQHRACREFEIDWNNMNGEEMTVFKKMMPGPLELLSGILINY